MADTVRTRSALLTLLADNTSGAISPQDIRDFLVSVHGVYGSIYHTGTSASSSVSLNDSTWTVLDGFSANGESSGTTPDHSSNQITVGTDGIYLVNWSVSGDIGMGASGYRMLGVEKNSSGSPENGTVVSVGDSEHACASMTALLSLSADDVLKLIGKNSGGTSNLVQWGMTLTVHRIA